ncbi:hypothetical protein [Streptomyces sp. URMC 123]|uniref:hypothetical protein n=1 Tax=Streptomyces sp. URMC 123 TaxID=3423403 RepID=UPI003F1B8A27
MKRLGQIIATAALLCGAAVGLAAPAQAAPGNVVEGATAGVASAVQQTGSGAAGAIGVAAGDFVTHGIQAASRL